MYIGIAHAEISLADQTSETGINPATLVGVAEIGDVL